MASVREPIRPRWWLPVALVALVALAAGCGGGGGGTTELGSDAADEQSGPLPTAPGGDSSGSGGSTGSGDTPGMSGSVDVSELIVRIDALNTENDLCTLLTGDAMADVTGADVNLTSIVSNPSGFSQLFSALDRLFGHMVQIGPPELTPSLQRLNEVWKGLAQVDPTGADAQAKLDTLMADPEVQAAQKGIAEWVAANCDVSGLTGG